MTIRNAWAIILTLGLVAPLPARAADDPLLGRLESVRKLIEESSAAQQVEGCDQSAAKERRFLAKALYNQALAAYRAGRREEAQALLSKATKAMFEAVRMADVDQVLADKQESDYRKRLDSVKALLRAHDRVSQEKRARDAGLRLRRFVERKVNEAEALRAKGQRVEGRARLDEAYVAAKVAIEHLRGGDTLVRSLHFETKEEEYRYELDRNDAHKLLVGVLLKDKQTARPGTDKRVRQFMDRAAQIRDKAERQAAKGDFEAAVQSLERSTKEIVRAIRSAGIYIPG